MKLYGIPNCNTVKKACDWLDANHISYSFHDFKKLGIDQTILDNWLTQQPWQKLVNCAGMTWRRLSEEAKANVTDNASACQLMTEKTSVIKRPILEKDGVMLCLGFDEDTYRKVAK